MFTCAIERGYPLFSFVINDQIKGAGYPGSFIPARDVRDIEQDLTKHQMKTMLAGFGL